MHLLHVADGADGPAAEEVGLSGEVVVEPVFTPHGVAHLDRIASTAGWRRRVFAVARSRCKDAGRAIDDWILYTAP